ncbi:MAG: DUF3127 domain-containing protein [Paludibacter sp.]|nr:DUF3127 domain-containing protein [Bacteroidales bacterium]MCM1068524.1 DUF3127 domain-containing protein [Prevotella sp.]MCM1353478.1 DUF3127 domain-containing protein [Bacteroides sp.]MCM1442639.1 DUF3127 domain-containing protein [Muribaculum sp.]MCM1481484.1 DUF3127 domain-containing protein [Paludibacter sp.]
MEITGKITTVLPLQQGTSKAGNPWQSQSYVLETQEQYPKKVCFEVFGEQRIKDNPCNIDDVVTVSFDLESREFNGRWYTSVRAWKITKAGNDANAQPTTMGVGNVETFTTPQQPAGAMDDGSDLPF